MIKIIQEILAISGRYQLQLKRSLAFTSLRAFSGFLPLAGLLWLLTNFPKIQVTVAWESSLLVLLGVSVNAWARKQVDTYQSATGYRIFADQRLQIGKLLKRLPLGVLLDRQHPDLVGLLTATMADLEQLCMQVFDKVTQALMLGLTLDLFLLFFSWPLGLLSILGELLALWVFERILIISEKTAVMRQETQTTMVAKVSEFIQGIAVAKSFNDNESASPLNHVRQAFLDSRKIESRLVKQNVIWIALFEIVITITSSSVGMLAIYFNLVGQLSVATSIAILIASFVMYAPCYELAGIAATVQVVHASLQEVNAVLNERPLAVLMPAAKHLVAGQPADLALKQVSFSYPNSQHPALRAINLNIPHGERLAIVGPSGSGKSTLCELLMRFWDVDQGEITLAGQNIKSYPLNQLLDYFAMVFQETYLFNDTIANNIRFGKPSATLAEVKEAAQQAHCADFIACLPAGYQTVVTNGGANFSGGQKQRIAIARAILKDPPIIIFDEATASLDPVNERQIMTALANLGRHKTVITIAHQLKTIRQADCIIVLAGGQVVQSGTHDQLYQVSGLYQTLVRNLEQASQWELKKRPG